MPDRFYIEFTPTLTVGNSLRRPILKVIAFYLPQFHNIPENDKWWGDGFTEWVNVKKATPQFSGHYQPHVPLNDNYYNLLDDETKRWQIALAKEYGVYGFCYYHYWFNGKLLLEKPMEQMLADPTLDLPFCISWANEPWTKAWVGENKVLMPQTYGGEPEWRDHFEYLLPFLRDKRYIVDGMGRPLFIIYRPEIVPCLNEMLDYWNALAIEAGFENGIAFGYQNVDFDLIHDKDDSRFAFDIEFEPLYAYRDMTKSKHKYLRAIRRSLSNNLGKLFGIDLLNVGQGIINRGNRPLSYDDAWECILTRRPVSKKSIPGAFTGFDNTPRRGKNAKIYFESTPEKFEKYLTCQIKRAREVYHSDMLFITAWNEWAEGGHLEPDEKYGYRYLEAVRKALQNNNELPDENDR